MALNLDKYNESVKDWGREILPVIKSKGAGHGVVHRADSPSPGSSLSKFRNRYASVDGAIAKVSITFPRSLVWTHKGAGKGRGGSKGSRWVDKYGNRKSTNPNSLGKMGTGGRTAKPFINEALDSERGMDQLANIAAEHLGDAVAGSLFIK